MKKEHYDKYRKLCLKIAYYRKLRGYTQEQLAEKIGKSVEYIKCIENVNIDYIFYIDIFLDISNALDVKPDKLLEED